MKKCIQRLLARLFPRWLHRVYAEANGYFVLPCPNCGREFYGHELNYCRDRSRAPGPGIWRIPCPKCLKNPNVEWQRA